MKYLELVKRYIQDEYTNHNKSALPFRDDWTLIPCVKGNRVVPTQLDTRNNCGVYTCIVMELLMNNIETSLLFEDNLHHAVEFSGRRSLWLSIKQKKPIFRCYYKRRPCEECTHNDRPSEKTSLFPFTDGEDNSKDGSVRDRCAIKAIINNSTQQFESMEVNNSLTPYIEEIAYHYLPREVSYSDKELNDLSPLSRPWDFQLREPMLDDDVEWSYDKQQRIVLADFTAVASIDLRYKRFLGEIMERDDLTVDSAGFLPPIKDLTFVFERFLSEVRDLPYETIRQFDRIVSGDKVTYQEITDGHLSMPVSDYVKYCNILSGDCPEQPFSYKDKEGKIHSFDKATDIVFYMLDIYIPRLFPSLNHEFEQDFKMKEIAPGGEWCMLNPVSGLIYQYNDVNKSIELT